MVRFFFFASAFLLFFTIYFHNIIEFDQDLGRHLLMGKIISETKTVPQTNLLSYSQTNFTYINSHWLSEVVFYQFSSRFGVVSLLYLKVAMMLAATMLTLFTAYKFSKNLTATAVALVILSPVLLERTEIRPEIFSYLFIAVFLFILFRQSGKGCNPYLWLLPALEALWVNVHIYFILGPVLVAIFLLRNKKLFLAFLLTCLATLFNPNGLSGALYPLRVFENYGYSIVENQNIFFLREMVFNPNIFYFGIAAGTFMVSIFLSFRRLLSYFPTFLLSLLIILPVIHIRSFPLTFLVELPVFALTLTHILGKGDFLKRTLLFKKSSFIVIVAAAIILNLLRSYRLASNQYYLSIDSSKRFGSEIVESGKGAADFVLTNKLKGPVFNNFDIGSYLDYRFYPTEKVFVDGRPEAYPKEFFQNLYIPMQSTAENFQKVDNVYKFNLIIFSHTDGTPWARSFLADIAQNKNFMMAYLDSYAVVFVGRETYPNLSVKIVEPKTYLDWLSFGQVAAVLSRTDVGQMALGKALQLAPESPAVNYALGAMYSQNPATAALGQQYLEKYRQKTRLILF